MCLHFHAHGFRFRHVGQSGDIAYRRNGHGGFLLVFIVIIETGKVQLQPAIKQYGFDPRLKRQQRFCLVRQQLSVGLGRGAVETAGLEAF